MKKVVMRRAQSMAQAAWRRPGLRLSSWSCMGPRQRASVAHLNSKEDLSLSLGSTTETSNDPLIAVPNRTRLTDELAASSSGAAEWTSEEIAGHHDDEIDGHEEDEITEVELWQQLEQELYEGTEEDRANEIREEEAAAMAEARDGEPEPELGPEMKEAHRFFPAGKIMHIVFVPPPPEEEEDDVDVDVDVECEAVEESENGGRGEPRVGIFLTPRSLYSKLRLSQTMISDHIMPAYRRQIEKLIEQLEEEEHTTSGGDA